MRNWNIEKIAAKYFTISKENAQISIPIQEISKIEQGTSMLRQQINSKVPRQFSYEQLLHLSYQQLHDMWIQIDDSKDWRYACEIERALNFAVKHRAIDELEEASTVRGILSASDDYAEAATNQRFSLYCK